MPRFIIALIANLPSALSPSLLRCPTGDAGFGHMAGVTELHVGPAPGWRNGSLPSFAALIAPIRALVTPAGRPMTLVEAEYWNPIPSEHDEQRRSQYCPTW